MTDTNHEDGMLRLIKALLNVIWVAAGGLALLWILCAAGYEKSHGIFPAHGHFTKSIFMISGKAFCGFLAFYFLSRAFVFFWMRICGGVNRTKPKYPDLKMPKLRPVMIPTEEHNLLMRHMVWMHSVRKWTLEKDWEYPLPKSNAWDKTIRIVIPKGFQFDGASIPRPLWGILHPSGLLLMPALVHDFAYRCGFLWEILEEKRIVEGSEGDIPPENIITRKIVEEKPGKVRRYELDRKGWDKLLRKIGADINGMSLMNFAAYLAVRGFGCFAWKKNKATRQGAVPGFEWSKCERPDCKCPVCQCKPPSGYMLESKDGEEKVLPPSDQEGNSDTQD